MPLYRTALISLIMNTMDSDGDGIADDEEVHRVQVKVSSQATRPLVVLFSALSDRLLVLKVANAQSSRDLAAVAAKGKIRYD